MTTKPAFEVRLLDPSVLFSFVEEAKALVGDMHYTTVVGFVPPEGTLLRATWSRLRTRGGLVIGKITRRRGTTPDNYRLAFHGVFWASFWDELVDVFSIRGIEIVQAKPRKVR